MISSDVCRGLVADDENDQSATSAAFDAAGALDVMSRFALHPGLLPYLPPTMTPVATSAREDLLEHPQEAFTAYRSDGLTTVICEEKHMGSHTVALLCRDVASTQRRFDASSGETGAVYTRTGRSFFSPDLAEQLLGRLRAAVTQACLWDELETDWLLLDRELLPWSAKAEDLLRDQYAAVGAAARSALPAALGGLEAASAAGIDVSALFGRTTARAANANAFTDAYRRYCWPVDGLDGVSVAPFQVLATDGATHHDRDHGWHLSVVDRLVDAAPDLVRTTRRLVVDTADEASVSEGITWWGSSPTPVVKG